MDFFLPAHIPVVKLWEKRREERAQKGGTILHQSVRHIKFPLFGQALYVYASIEDR